MFAAKLVKSALDSVGWEPKEGVVEDHSSKSAVFFLMAQCCHAWHSVVGLGRPGAEGGHRREPPIHIPFLSKGTLPLKVHFCPRWGEVVGEGVKTIWRTIDVAFCTRLFYAMRDTVFLRNEGPKKPPKKPGFCFRNLS